MNHLFVALLGLLCAALPFFSVTSAEAGNPDGVSYTVPADLSDEEKKWYVTFQTGNTLSEGWVQITRDLLKTMPEAMRPEHKKRLRALGDHIGREWCKNNKTRRIDTGMLKKWGKELKDASRKDPQTLSRTIGLIERRVAGIVH